MSNKDVLFLTSWYPSEENSTLGNFVVKHAECSAEIADVTVLYAVSTHRVEDIQVKETMENSVRVIRVYYPKVKSKLPVFKSVLKMQKYKAALQKGYEYLGKKFDIVHLNVAFPAGLFALELKKKYNIPFILLEHWTGYLSHTNTFEESSIFVRKLHADVFKNASKVLVVSDHLGRSLCSLGLIDDYSVYPNVVDEEVFYPASTKKVSEEINIVHVSSFDEDHKNISGMLKAIANVNRPYKLNLITETKTEFVEDVLSRFNIDLNKVLIKSRASSEEVGSTMRSSDVFVLFSNYETFSIVIAEAWMSGIPSIYTQCGGLTEIDDKALGIRLPKNDQQGLTYHLENFNSNDYSISKISEFSKQFGKKTISDKIRNIYDQFC